jgi:hypothetical protein
VVGAWLAAAQGRHRQSARPARGRWVHGCCAAALILVLIDNGRHPVAGDLTIARSRMNALAAVGDDRSVTGLLVDSIFFWGGSVWFGRNVPQLNFEPALLGNPVFSHVLTESGSNADQRARQAGFIATFARDGLVILRRP